MRHVDGDCGDNDGDNIIGNDDGGDNDEANVGNNDDDNSDEWWWYQQKVSLSNVRNVFFKLKTKFTKLCFLV